MFKFLKDTLKKAAGLFSKKVEEEGEEKIIEKEILVEKKIEKSVVKPVEKKPEKLIEKKVEKPIPKAPEKKELPKTPEKKSIEKKEKEKPKSAFVKKIEKEVKSVAKEATKEDIMPEAEKVVAETEDFVKGKVSEQKKPDEGKLLEEKTPEEKDEELSEDDEILIDDEKADEKSEKELEKISDEAQAAEEKEEKKEKVGFFKRFFGKKKGEEKKAVSEKKPEKKEEVVEEKVSERKGEEEKVVEKEVVEESEEQKKYEEPAEERPEEESPAEKEETTLSEEAAQETEEEKPEKKQSFFEKIKQRIVTKVISDEKFEELFFDMEVALLENNVAVEVIDKLKNDLKKKLVGVPIPRNKIEETILYTLKKSIEGLFKVSPINIIAAAKQKKPYIISFVGVNGSGKTTTIAKIAHYLKKNNLTSVISASDTFRAAAIDQLGKHAEKLGVKMIKHDYGADPAAVAFDAIKYAEAKGIDVVLVDTAGRLHSDTNLMDELKKIHRVSNPDLTLFIGEAITGNDCVEQARQFNQAVEIDAIILTKADVDEKGGASLSVSYVTGKPILFLGTGQTYDDLMPFSKDLIMRNLGL